MKHSKIFCVRLFTAASALAFIVGCASTQSMYSACDQKSERFTEVAACTKAALRADSRYGFHSGYIA